MDGSDTAVISIVETVAAASRTTVTDLPPLSEAIDPDALNALVDPESGPTTTLSVSFDYAGHEVVVDRDGRVTVTNGVERESEFDAQRPDVEPADGTLAE